MRQPTPFRPCLGEIVGVRSSTISRIHFSGCHTDPYQTRAPNGDDALRTFMIISTANPEHYHDVSHSLRKSKNQGHHHHIGNTKGGYNSCHQSDLSTYCTFIGGDIKQIRGEEKDVGRKGNTESRVEYQGWQLGGEKLGDTTDERNPCSRETAIHQHTCFHFADQETEEETK